MSYLPGNVVRFGCTFTPITGNTVLANVTARVEDPLGTETSLTVVQTATDVYYADATVPDDAEPGKWVVRFESSDPQISQEQPFSVKASKFTTP